MNIRITIDIDQESGEYDLVFSYPENPGGQMEYWKIVEIARRVLSDLDRRVDTAGEA